MSSRTTQRYKPPWVQQRQQGGTVQFHAGDIKYATADLLSGSERDLRQQRRSLFQTACRKARNRTKFNCLTQSTAGKPPA